MRVVRKPKFPKTLAFFDRIRRGGKIESILHDYGRRGVSALSNATPVDSGDTASAWGYKVVKDDLGYVLTWTNSEMAGSVPLVILLQYGHNTKSGYWIPGRDFINPALEPIFDGIQLAIKREYDL